MKSYRYDVFLSFTGADRDLKNEIKQRFEGIGLSYYDSDMYCKGQFRPDFCEALDESRVYLMILSDNLRNDPAVTGTGTLTEVRRECSLACELEARNELNIVILCLSEFFRFTKPFHDHSDTVGWFFYSMTRGFSHIRGMVEGDGTLTEKTLEELTGQCRAFIDKRNAGTPIISQSPRREIVNERLLDRGTVKGREEQIEATLEAFKSGDQVVVLSGMGGIGKTTLAVEIARRCEEQGYLRCPQVVHVRELSGSAGGGLQTLVSSVAYTKGLYDGLATLAERDKYERKLNALAALPETDLLVVDNYNTLTPSDVSELLTRLKCRLLITTRAKMESAPDSTTVIRIGSLDPDAAFEMFCEISGTESDRRVFESLYHYVGGHTITLCIMARLMAVHRIPLEEMLGEITTLEKFDARVDFRHNEYGDSDTVLGHLKKLFGISDFDEGCCRILRSMSILGNGTVPLDDLMRILSLRNRNEILTLTGSGWLELQKREEGGVQREYLYLHPILSRLMANLLTPTEENVSEMIGYLTSRSDAARESMTYADASLLEDGLYYACYVLAGGGNRLSHALWTRFVEVNHLLGNVEATAQKTKALAARVNDATEQSVITSYMDMITLEQYPTRVEILDKYLATLDRNARDYKWVMRSLSVTLRHIQGVEQFRPFLLRALEKALDAAIVQEDDIALLDLFVYYMQVTKNIRTLFHRIRSYIRGQKKKGRMTGALLYLELMVGGSIMTASRNASEYIERTLKLLNDALNDNLLSSLKMAVMHPVLFAKTVTWEKHIERLEEDDPMYYPLSIIAGETNRFAVDGQIDASSLIEATVHLYRIRLEQQTTLASASDAVRGLLQMIRTFPEDVVRKGMGELVDSVDMNHISVRSLSNLQVAMLINREFNNREAVSQARQVIDVLRRLYPEGHGSIISATVSYGDICEAFGDSKTAFQAYVESYRHMKKTTPDSAELAMLARKLLALKEVSGMSVSALEDLLDIALFNLEEYSASYYWSMATYLCRLLEKAKSDEIGFDDPAFDRGWDAFYRASRSLKRLDVSTQLAVIRHLDNIATICSNYGQFERVESMLVLFRSFCKSRKKSVRIPAQIYEAFAVFYSTFHQGQDEMLEKGKAVLELCIRHKSMQRLASTVVWLFISYFSDRQILPEERMISSAEILEELAALSRRFEADCVVYKGLEAYADTAEEQKQRALRQILCEQLKRASGELCRNDMNLSPRAYVKIRSVETLCGTLLHNLMEHLILKYQSSPFTVTFRAPDEPRPFRVPKPSPIESLNARRLSRETRWHLPAVDFYVTCSREWSLESVVELRRRLLCLSRQSYACKPLKPIELPADDPTGEWTDRAEAVWKKLRARIAEGRAAACPPPLLFDRDDKLSDALASVPPLEKVSADSMQALADFLQTLGGVLPEAYTSEETKTWEMLDRAAAEQRYPRPLLVFAGFALCVGDPSLQHETLHSISDAHAMLEQCVNPYLTEIGYSPLNVLNPLDRYASGTLLVCAIMQSNRS